MKSRGCMRACGFTTTRYQQQKGHVHRPLQSWERTMWPYVGLGQQTKGKDEAYGRVRWPVDEEISETLGMQGLFARVVGEGRSTLGSLVHAPSFPSSYLLQTIQGLGVWLSIRSRGVLVV